MKRTAVFLAVILSPAWFCGAAAADPKNPMSAEELAALTGGANPTIGLSYQALSAANSGNNVEAQSLVTGTVTLQAESFSGFNGVGNFVFNTGNNNNLQGTLSVTVMAPAAN